MTELSNDVKVIAAVITERKRQDMQWGGPAHDDTHDEYEWLAYMAHQADKITEILAANGFYGSPFHRDPVHGDKPTAYSQTREHFIKIAALAVAAVESLDRKNKS